MATASATTDVHAKRSRDFRCETIGVGTPDCEPVSAIHFNSSSRSRAVCQRSSGSFAQATANCVVEGWRR